MEEAIWKILKKKYYQCPEDKEDKTRCEKKFQKYSFKKKPQNCLKSKCGKKKFYCPKKYRKCFSYVGECKNDDDDDDEDNDDDDDDDNDDDDDDDDDYDDSNDEEEDWSDAESTDDDEEEECSDSENDCVFVKNVCDSECVEDLAKNIARKILRRKQMKKKKKHMLARVLCRKKKKKRKRPAEKINLLKRQEKIWRELRKQEELRLCREKEKELQEARKRFSNETLKNYDGYFCTCS